MGCLASCCTKPWLPTATSGLQFYIPHPTHHSSCFTGAKETPSHLFYQLPLLPPPHCLNPAANEFTHTQNIFKGEAVHDVIKYTSCALL